MRHGYPPVWLSAALLALALMWRMVGAPLTATQFEDMQTPLWQARVLLPTRVGRILRLWMPGAQEAQAQTIREEALGEEGQVLDRLMNGEDQQTISVYLAQEGRVVEMALESYVCGVVAAEMPASFSQEALKAQAHSGNMADRKRRMCAARGCGHLYRQRALSGVRHARPVPRAVGRGIYRLP